MRTLDVPARPSQLCNFAWQAAAPATAVCQYKQSLENKIHPANMEKLARTLLATICDAQRLFSSSNSSGDPESPLIFGLEHSDDV
jgi:hypothetical protein